APRMKTEPDAGPARWRRLYEWVFLFEGSTRPIALVRIGLVLIWWTRTADYFAFWVNQQIDRLIIGAIFFASTTLVLVGLATRVALAVLALTSLTFCYHYGYQQHAAWIFPHHHILLLTWVTCFLALSPCDRSYSIDRWLA